MSETDKSSVGTSENSPQASDLAHADGLQSCYPGLGAIPKAGSQFPWTAPILDIEREGHGDLPVTAIPSADDVPGWAGQPSSVTRQPASGQSRMSGWPVTIYIY